MIHIGKCGGTTIRTILKKYKYNFLNKHIQRVHNFYIGNFLNKCKAENIRGIIMTETLKEDLNRIFNINDEIPHRLKNKEYDTTLSELGYNNLKKYLNKDYECIDKLYKMNLLTQGQYDILSA